MYVGVKASVLWLSKNICYERPYSANDENQAGTVKNTRTRDGS